MARHSRGARAQELNLLMPQTRAGLRVVVTGLVDMGIRCKDVAKRAGWNQSYLSLFLSESSDKIPLPAKIGALVHALHGIAREQPGGGHLLEEIETVAERYGISLRDPPAIVDGHVTRSSQAVIPLVDDGLWRGDGVFEVIRLYRGRPWALDEHLERMALSARNLRLEFSPSAVAADVALLLERAGPVDAFLRFAVTRGGRRLGLIEEVQEAPATVSVMTIEYTPAKLMDAIKSISYAANMLAVRVAKEHGAEEALFVTPHGRVLEAPRASFFYVLNGRLCTPPLDGQVLDSITRRHLLAVTETRERVTARDDLVAVSEAFLASTVKEVQPVHAIDGRPLGAAPGPVTEAAAAGLRQRMAEALADV